MNDELAKLKQITQARIVLPRAGNSLTTRDILKFNADHALARDAVHAGPKPGNTDAARNCISNIRPPNGLSYENAAIKVISLLRESMKNRFSGIE